MNRFIFFILSVLILFFIVSCDQTTPVSKTERLEMFIDDLNASNYGDMPDHFSHDNMGGGGWNSVTTSTYWSGSDGWDLIPYTYSITSSSSTSITADLTNKDALKLTYVFSFVEEDEDIWLIYKVVRDGTTILE